MMTVVEQATPDHDEQALAEVAEQVAAAREALQQYLAAHPANTWSPRGLQREVQNRWLTSVVSIAFWQLVANGELAVDEQLRVSIAALA